MEEILHLYQLPYDPLRPLWCFDERPCQLIGDTLVPLPMEAGKPLRQNYEYERNGTSSVLFAVQPHSGLCFAQVRHQRTACDYAEFMQALSQAHCPPGGQIVLVQDNLNTHTPASFYVAFTPERAFALKQTFEVHYTPKKASWLNMAEIELSVLSKQCLDRRIPSFAQLETEVLTWVRQRNQKPVPIRWQFTPALARLKFKRFYPNPSKLR
jgi:DDE superfamily endonuclease